MTAMYSKQLTPQISDEFLRQHAPLVKRIAYHLAARLPPSVIMDDLIQAGMIGLLDAARQYDPSQGAAFDTYATIRIRGAMLDELRRNDWAPKSVHRKERDIMRAVREIEHETGRDARDEEIANKLGISLDDYHKQLHETSNCRVFSLDDLGMDEGALDEHLADHNSSPLEQLQSEDLKRVLGNAIANLPERERLVVTLYYHEELNLREIGMVMGVTESRVSQLMSQAMLRLRTRMSR